MLSDVLILVVGLALLLIGLQTFMDPVKRKIPTEVLKATFIMVAALFLIYIYYVYISASSGRTNTSNLYR